MKEMSYMQARLLSRPGQRTSKGMPAGLHPLGLEEVHDGLIFVPTSYREDRPAPLVLMLHGAGGTARGGLAPFLDVAEANALLLLALDSRLRTWDVIMGGYGPDVELIDRALQQTFSRYAVDPAHLALEGFSDGASYALSLGLTNGDLFSHIIVFSPGFMAPGRHYGRPRIYISHGIKDPVLPIDRCSRRIVPQLRAANYDLLYHEFPGVHNVPADISDQALHWFLTADPPT